MRQLFVLFFLMLINCSLSAQKQCKLPSSKDLNDRYNKALLLYEYNKSEAVPALENIVAQYPSHFKAAFVLGDYYLSVQKKSQSEFANDASQIAAVKALKYLKLSFDYCIEYDSCAALFDLGEFSFINRNFTDADKFFFDFISNENASKVKMKYAQMRKAMIDEYFNILKNPVKFNPREVKDICTTDDEYLPQISPDGSMIFFSRRVKKSDGEYIEELMVGKKIPVVDTTYELFSEGIKMPSPFNQGKIQGGASITVDNKVIYITICGYDRMGYSSQLNCDLYYSIFDSGRWGQLQKLPNTVNSSAFEGQPSVDVSGNVLYFSSNRPGGYGGFDIWKIVRVNSESLWSSPVNLGPRINTSFDEKTPFIHGDGRTLYFSSNGHPGLGGMDIFYSRLSEDEINWSKPENIGYPINTEGDEVAYVVSADGKRIYFSSKYLSGTGGWDIYSSELYPEAAPGRILLFKGKITDDNGTPVPDVNVELTGLKTYETAYGVSDKNTGEYYVGTPVNENEDYMLSVKKSGFFYDTRFIDTDSLKYIPPTREDIILCKVKAGVPVLMDNVVFDSNSASLAETATPFLQQFLLFLKDNPDLKIQINGYTDNIGTPESNLALSKRRCKTVINYLVMSGIDQSRLSYKAYGQTQPVSDNNTVSGRALNRRVEFVIIE